MSCQKGYGFHSRYRRIRLPRLWQIKSSQCYRFTPSMEHISYLMEHIFHRWWNIETTFLFRFTGSESTLRKMPWNSSWKLLFSPTSAPSVHLGWSNQVPAVKNSKTYHLWGQNSYQNKETQAHITIPFRLGLVKDWTTYGTTRFIESF